MSYANFNNSSVLTCLLYQDALVEAVANVNNNTIVVVNTVGPIIVEAWIDHPNVTGLVSPHKTFIDYISSLLQGLERPPWPRSW